MIQTANVKNLDTFTAHGTSTNWLKFKIRKTIYKLKFLDPFSSLNHLKIGYTALVESILTVWRY